MEYYYSNVADIRLARGMQEDPILTPNYPGQVEHQGHTYSLYKVYSRQLSGKEKILTFFECLGQAIISFGTVCSTNAFRDKWQSIFGSKHVRVVYLKTLHTTQIPIPAPVVPEPAPLAGNANPVLNNPSNPIPATPATGQYKLTLNGLLHRTLQEDGLNISSLNPEEKKMMAAFNQRWLARKEVGNTKWTVDELSALLDVEVKDLQDLLFRIQFFNSPTLPLNSEALAWLFKSIDKELKNETRGSMQGGIKMIWDSRQVVQGQENRCPKGMDFPSWKLNALSMFLAVKKSALVEFFKLKGVLRDAEGNFSAQDIDNAFKTATNGEINSILSTQRTQTKSIRFASN